MKKFLNFFFVVPAFFLGIVLFAGVHNSFASFNTSSCNSYGYDNVTNIGSGYICYKNLGNNTWVFSSSSSYGVRVRRDSTRDDR